MCLAMPHLKGRAMNLGRTCLKIYARWRLMKYDFIVTWALAHSSGRVQASLNDLMDFGAAKNVKGIDQKHRKLIKAASQGGLGEDFMILFREISYARWNAKLFALEARETPQKRSPSTTRKQFSAASEVDVDWSWRFFNGQMIRNIKRLSTVIRRT